MTHTAVDADQAPAAVGPYSHAVRHGGLLFLSGQAPLDPATGKVVDGGIEAQTRQVFTNLDAVLAAAGSSFADVIKVNVYLTDIADFPMVNAIYYFTDKKSVAQLARFPQHREAKGQVQRWYDGSRIVISEVKATYGDGRLPN